MTADADFGAHPGPARAEAVPTSACLQTLAPSMTPAEAVSGNAVICKSAAIAFAQHWGNTTEPPLKPFASAA